MSRRWVVALVSGALLCCGSLAVGQPEAGADPERSVEFTITDDRIVQSSGLATDPVNRVYWTINDVAGEAVVYALNKNGKTTGTLRYDAEPTDVESIAYNKGKLYVGDTGGNRRKRTVITVYEFNQPRPDDSVQDFRSFQFSYPDGPHDTEAMLVDARGRFIFVTKAAESGEIFAAPAELSSVAPNPLTQVGEVPQYITDGTVLADGRMILRSYLAVFQLDPRTFRITALAATPTLKQGESVTAPLTGRGLLIGSEGKQSEVLRVPVPTRMDVLPTIATSVGPSPLESATPAAHSESPQATTSSMLPLYGGGALLVVAGGLTAVVLRRRRAGSQK